MVWRGGAEALYHADGSMDLERNEALRQLTILGKAPSPVDEETLRRVLREEFHTTD